MIVFALCAAALGLALLAFCFDWLLWLVAGLARAFLFQTAGGRTFGCWLAVRNVCQRRVARPVVDGLFLSSRLVAGVALLGALAGLFVPPARATGIELALAGLGAGLGLAPLNLLATNAIYAAFVNIGLFIVSPLGLTLLAGAVLGVSQLLSRPENRPRTDSAKYNVKIEAGYRRIAIGKSVRVGGNVAFGEFDGSGHFWYLIYHCDSELMSVAQPMLDDVLVTLDGSNYVTDDAYSYENQAGTTSRTTRLWTVSFTHDDVTPALPSAFTTAFSGVWTADHKLVGTTCTIVQFLSGVSREDRAAMPRFRGPFGIGEPWVSIVGDFTRFPDPREAGYDAEDPDTWVASGNPAIAAAWLRMHRLGDAFADIDWDRISIEADISDQLVTDKYDDDHVRYECGLVIEDDMQNAAALREVLLTCDGMIVYDDAGRFAIDVGYWEEPAVTLSEDRDIMGMTQAPIEDGEAPMDGWVVYFLDPSNNYVKTPAIWQNPGYFDAARAPNFGQTEVLGCHDFNQASRLAKSIGQRSQATLRLAPEVGLRGLLTQQSRSVTLHYEDLSAVYEIIAPVEVDAGGMRCALGIVPADDNRWVLLSGEEGDKPGAVGAVTFPGGYDAPDNMTITAVAVPGSEGNSVRFEAVWDPLARTDREVMVQYKKDGTSTWLPFPVILQYEEFAYTAPVDDGSLYNLRYRTESVADAGDWESYSDITAIADSTPPAAVSGVSVTPGTGVAQFDYTNPASSNYAATQLYVNAADNFGTATLAATRPGAVGASDSITEGLAAGTWYAWLVAINGSGVASSEVATGSFVVS